MKDFMKRQSMKPLWGGWLAGILCWALIYSSQVHAAYQNTPWSPEVKQGFFLEGEFLYWKAVEDGLDYALKRDLVAEEFITDRKVKEVEYDWHSGYRVGAGYRLPWSWDIALRYTHYRSHDRDSAHTELPEGNVSDLDCTLVRQANARILSGISRIKLRYNTLDLDFSRHHFAINRLHLVFLLGGRAAWIEQRWKNRFVPRPIAGSIPGVTSVDDNWRIAGGGPRVGMEGNVALGAGFAITGNAAISGIVARQKVHFATVIPGGGLFMNRANFTTKQTRFFPEFETGLGLKWSRYFNNSWGLQLLIKYELLNWWNINDVMRLGDAEGIDDQEPGNLGLHGVTAHLTIDF